VSTPDLHGQKEQPGNSTSTINWGNQRIRWDINLRLNQQYRNKLNFILHHSNERSLHSVLLKAVDQMMEEKVRALLDAGLVPHIDLD